MASESFRSSSSSADSYIGSLISLTSKSEIRYEGILYSINTEESSIGLTNVRSFGTEGRKKDGPQLMPSDKVYEYILFRGSDIKDLQVKSSQPVQSTQPINSDPAIIQSRYPRPATTSTSLPAASNSLPGPSTHNAHLGHPGSTFQGGLPLYQPGGSGNVGSWGPPPPPQDTNSSGLAMPMYWPGYYAPPNGLPQLHQQPLPRAPQGMPPSLQQPMQYPSFNASLPSGAPNTSTPNLPEYPSPLLPTSTSSANFTSNSLLGSTLPSSLPSVLATESLPALMHNKAPESAVPVPPLNGSLQPQSGLTTAAAATDVNVTISPISDKPNVLSGAKFPYLGTSQPISSVTGASLIPTESPTPSLVTPGQLLQSGPAPVVSAQSSQAVHKDVEVVQVSPASSSAPSLPVPLPTEAQPPILPLPPQTRIAPKPNGATYQNRQSYSYRGRERGRGSWGSRPVMKFTEEFDFNAMNEKFNKDEVWGTLGKSNKSRSKEKDGDASDEDESEEENDPNLLKVDVKPVYSKDDFFDTLSCNSLEHQSNNGRTRFSEQMKLDTETFGEFSRYRGGGRGGRGPYRGGRYRGGGYYGRGYGYVGRGRGVKNPNPAHDY